MKIKAISYNIDGLPESLDLKDLPWPLKPIAWVYKLIKKTTKIQVNDNPSKASDISKIGELLAQSNADIIGVQEDFNYHEELTKSLTSYTSGKHSGGFDLKHLFSTTKWTPLPRFKADGINLFAHKNSTSIDSEKPVCWGTSYGYISHANDKLTYKGFRYYQTVINKVDVDIYVLHMDADFYDPENCPDVSKDLKARKSQLQQLVKFIKKQHREVPIIIMGDTNCYPQYEWDVKNLQENLIDPINEDEDLTITTAGDFIDKLFVINNREAEYKIDILNYEYDKSYEGLSDHLPLVVELEIK